MLKWQVKMVTARAPTSQDTGEQVALDGDLADGWEPFFVTDLGIPWVIYHLRRQYQAWSDGTPMPDPKP